MNCIFLLLLLGCCGGFGGDGRSGDNFGCDGDGRSGGRSGGSNNSSRGNGSNNRNGFPTVGSGFQEATPFSENDCGCGDNNQGIRSVSDGNPSNWQDYPEISRRENCDSCEQ